MRRTIGFLLLIHGLAHAAAGIGPATSAPVWLVTTLWWLAIIGFVSAAAGLLGVSWIDRHWRAFANTGALASLALIGVGWHPMLMIGAAIDGAILLDSIPFVHRSVVRSLGVPEHPTRRHLANVQWPAGVRHNTVQGEPGRPFENKGSGAIWLKNSLVRYRGRNVWNP